MNYGKVNGKFGRDSEMRLNSGDRMTSSHKKVAVKSQGLCRPNTGSKIPCSGDRSRAKRTAVTNYATFLKRSPPPLPPNLLKSLNQNDDHVINPARRKEQPGVGKVKIVLRVAKDRSLKPNTQENEFIRVEANQKHVSVFTPGAGANTNNSLAPKVYAFDSVFTDRTPQMEICTSSLSDVIPAVLHGADGTIFCYGQSNLGKTSVLMGNDNNISEIGIIPCAISWLYRSIQECEQQGNCKFVVSCSSIEVYGRQEKLRDLLAGYSEDPTSPKALTVSEDPLTGVQLQNQCEIRASTPERAAFYLDVALTSRSCNGSRNNPVNRKQSHMIFTLNVTQTRPGDPEGKRSRLHFIDLGSCEKTLIKTPSSLALSLSSLGHVIMSIVNNSKHVPFRESKLTCVLREYLGNLNCRAVMLAHVSPDQQHYSDTLSTIQMASRIHRVIRKKNKCSGKENGYSHPMTRSKQLRSASSADESIGSSSGMEYTSGSELSCDTIVYVNSNGVLRSDHELTDNESPPLMVPIPQTFIQPRIPTVIEEEMIYNIREAQIQSSPSGNGFQKNNTIGLQHEGSNQDSGRRLSKKNGTSPNATNIPQNCFIPCPRSKLSRNAKPQIAPSSQNKAKNNVFTRSTNLTQPINHKAKPTRVNGQTIHNTKTDNKFNFNTKPSKPPRNLSESRSHNSKPTNRMSGSIPKPMPITQLHVKKSKKLSKTHSQIKSHVDKGLPAPPRRSSSLVNTQKPVVDKRQVNQENRSSNEIARPLKVPSDINRVHEVALNTHENPETTENAKTVSDTVMHENIYENVILKEMYPTSNDQRFEPDGCDHEDHSLQQPEQFRYDFKAPSNNQRPDSMLVNIDDEISSDDDTICDVDDDVVGVNFYCLTFTSNKPLVPLSRRKFCQQVQNSKKQKTLPNESEVIYNNCDITPNNIQNDVQNSVKSDLGLDILMNNTCDWAWKSKDAPTSHPEGTPVPNSSDLEVLDFESDEVFGREEEPDYTEVHSPEAKNENVVLADVVPTSKSMFSQNTPSKINTESPQVCVYDSNSLEMSYIGTRLKSDVCSVNSPSRSSNNSSHGVPDGRMRYNKPVTVTKTTSKEGTRLTLVKKNPGSSLELMITQDNFSDSENNNLTKTNKKSLNISKNKAITGSDVKKQQKSPKWSGLKRFGSKRLDSKPSKLIPKQTKPPTKSTFVSKILSGKLKQKSDPLKPKTPQKSKEPIGIPVTISNMRSEAPASPINQISSDSRIRIPGSISRFGFPKKYNR